MISPIAQYPESRFGFFAWDLKTIFGAGGLLLILVGILALLSSSPLSNFFGLFGINYDVTWIAFLSIAIGIGLILLAIVVLDYESDYY